MGESRANRFHRLMSEAFDVMTEIGSECADPDKKRLMESLREQIMRHAIVFMASTDRQFMAVVLDRLRKDDADRAP